MSDEDLCFSTLHQLSEGVRRHKFSPVEVVETHLRRCERLNPLLNAFITLAAESALEAARQAEREIAAGNYRGPLHGIPDRPEGRFQYGRYSYHEWFLFLSRLRSERRCGSRAHASGRRCRNHRKMQPSRVCGGARQPTILGMARPAIRGIWSDPQAVPAAVRAQPWPPSSVQERPAPIPGALSEVRLLATVLSALSRLMVESACEAFFQIPGVWIRQDQ